MTGREFPIGAEVCVSVRTEELRAHYRKHAVVTAVQNGWKYTIVLDDGTEITTGVGNLHRWVTNDEIVLAAANALEAGYKREMDGWFETSWDTGGRHGYGAPPDDDRLPLGLVDSFAHTVRCAECNIPTEHARRHCSTCGHWLSNLKDQSNAAIIEGHHYRIGNGSGSASSRGFGGRVFRLRFHGGREVTCNDLWFQGKIHPRFRDRLPDNCDFVKETA